MLLLTTEELALLTGLSERKILKLSRRGIISPASEEELKEQPPEGNEEEMDELVSAEELADILDVTPRWIRQMTQDGIFTAVKVKGERGSFYFKIKAMIDALKYYREKGEDR